MQALTAAATVSAALLLAGCGGGSDAPAAPGPTDAVPASASASSTGLKDYLLQLAGMQVDDKEPVDLTNFAPPTPDDTEPEVGQ